MSRGKKGKKSVKSGILSIVSRAGISSGIAKSGLKERLHKIAGYIMAVMAVVAVGIVFGGAYCLIIAPNLVSKPLIEKPSLPKDWVKRINSGERLIDCGHISYILNEIGAYKLKKPFWTKDYPVIEVVLTDVGERFYGYVNKHKPITKKGNAKNEDIVVKASQETVAGILLSDDTLTAVKEARSNGDIEVELKKDMKTLASKGYLSVYDSLK